MTFRVRVWMLSLVLALGAPPARAQDEATPAPDPAEPTVRFTLNGAPYDQVLDLLARQTGLPVIRQTEVPGATMTFISPEQYTLPEAVEIVNLAFKAHGVRLERDESFLYLRTIADAATRPTPVLGAEQLADVAPDDYATIFLPLENALASVLAERLTPLVSDPGMVQAVDAQNLLIIVETGEQCRRLAELVARVDTQRPADVDYGLYPLRHATASELVETIRSLVPERDQLVTIDNNKQPKVYDDVSKAALKLSASEQLNAIIAVGPPTRLTIVQDLVEALDTPAGATGGRAVRSYVLAALNPNEAAKQLQPLFAEQPAARRPIVRPLPSVRRIVVAADPQQMEMIERVLVELDPGVLERTSGEPEQTRVTRLEHLEPRDAQSMLERLLPAHQKTLVRISPTPDGSGLAVSGPGSAMTTIEDLLGALDTPPDRRAEARRVPIERGHPDEVLAEAMRIDQLTDDGRRDPARPILHPEDRSVTLVGSAEAIARVQGRIADAQDTLARRLITRVIDVRATEAEMIVEPLLGLVAGSPSLRGHAAPDIRVIESSNSLVVTADAPVLDAVEDFARRLDRAEERPETVIRVFELRSADAASLARDLEQRLNDRSHWPEALARAAVDGAVPRPTARADARANRVIVEAPQALIPDAEALVDALDGVAPARVEVRAFRLAEGDAESVAQALRAALGADVAPGDPTPSVTPEPGSNTVIVTGSSPAVARAEELVAAMDERAEVEGLGVRTVVLQHARAESVAPTVERLLAQDNLVDLVPVWLRWQMIWELERRGRPVDIRTARVAADPRANAVIITAPLDLLDMGERIAHSLDVEQADARPDRAVAVIPLSSADAVQVEPVVRAVFEDGEDTSVAPPTVRADRSSNALIVRGTPAQVTAIRELASNLDAAAATSTSQVRTVPVDPSRLDAEEAARRVRAMLERRGGVRVEIITADELKDEGAQRDDDAREPEGQGSTGSQSDAGWVAPGGLPIGPIAGWQPQPEEPDAPAADEQADEPVVRITVDPATNTLVVEGSERVGEQIARIVRDLERQTPPEATAVRIVELPAGVDPNAIASYVNQTVRLLGRTGPDNPGGFTGRVGVTPDRATGSLIVWANDTDFASIRTLIAGLSRAERPFELTIKIYQLDNVNARRAQQTMTSVLSPNRGPGRRSGEITITLPAQDGEPARTATIDPAVVTVTTDPSYTALVVTAPDGSFDVIDALVQSIDKSPAGERLAIRRYELEHAEASQLARALQQLFDASRQGPVAWEAPRARFVADQRANALMVTATRAQHAEIGSILAEADRSEDIADARLEIIGIREGRPSAIARVIEEVLIGRDPGKKEALRLSPQDDARVLVVRAPEEDLEEIRSLVSQLDQQQGASYPVRSIALESADAEAVARSLQQFFRDRARINRQRGIGTGGGDAAIVGDRRSGTIVVAASDEDYGQIASLVEQFDTPAEGREIDYRIVQLEHIQVSDIEDTVQSLTWQMRWERSGWFRGNRGGNDEAQDRVYIETNERTNTVLLFGNGDTFDLIEQIISELDQPGSDVGQMVVRAVAAPGADLDAIARIIEETTGTPDWGWWRGRDPNQVQVEIDRRRRVLLLVGKQALVEAAVEQVEAIARDGVGAGELVEVVALEFARAPDLARALQQALPEQVRAKVTPVARTNSVMLTGTPEDLELVRAKIAELDTEPERPPLEFRRFALDHADATELSIVLRELVGNRPRGRDEPEPGIDYLLDTNTVAVTATSDEMAFIAEMIAQFDVERETERTTEFVRLEYADAEQTAEALKVFYGRFAPEATTNAERSVSIVPDPASNSLVISADASTWEGIRELLVTLDTEEYDTSQQLVVIPLRHASARSVARALNEGFRQPLEDQLDRERVRLEAERRARGNRDRDFIEPAVLVESEGVPVVSAEVQSNSLIVFAGRKELERIRQIVVQLDVADFLELPEARILPIRNGRASAIAEAARRVFVAPNGDDNPRRVVIEGDDVSDTVLVRADDEQFEEIRTFVADLESRAAAAQPRARVIRVRTLPAARVREAVLRTFRPVAQQRGEVLSVEIERTSNALVVSATEPMQEQIAELVGQLDGAAGEDAAPGVAPANTNAARAAGFGAGVTVVPVERTTPRAMIASLEGMGVTRATPADRPGLVIDPVSLVALPGQSAVGVVGQDADVAVVTRIIGMLDRDPAEGEQSIGVVRLKVADAGQVVQRVQALLDADGSVTEAGPARALAEHVRRLRLERDGGPVRLDLSVPVRLIADPASNSVLIASTGSNVTAVEAFVRLMDRLPVGEAVMVRIFPLENGAAERVERVLEDLFREGDRVRRASGTDRATMPGTAVGRALAGEIAVTTDERTNSVIVAGPEAALALVEVLIADLDSDKAGRGWLETAVIELEHADAVTLAQKLDRVLVDGLGETPEAVGLRRQIGRLRVGGAGDEALDTDLFAPMSDVVIEPEEVLNALIVVATPTNVRAIRELVGMLDTERADAANSVRVIPLAHADARRVADIVEGTFEERERLPSSRPEDAVGVTVDERTNALVVTTSPRSFAILDTLIATLDQPESRFAVGLHVIPVPGADVEALAPRIERLMRDRLEAARVRGGRESPMDVFSIEADPAADVLIVAASDENLALVRELIETLTVGQVADAGPGGTALIQLEAPGRAREIAEAVDELYVQPQVEKRGARAVAVVANERLNALLVTGTEEDVAAIRDIASRLDTTAPGLVEEVRRIPLDSASARETVDLIEDVLAGRAISGASAGPRATRVRVITDRLEDAEALIDGDIRDQVNLTPDPRTNSVLVKAPPELMDLIVAIVTDLDREKRGDRVIEAFRLVNADAVQMQQLLVDLFNLERQGERYVLSPYGEVPVEGESPESPLAARAVTPIADEQRELSVTVDRRTNTLLASGTVELMEEVRRVVEALDSIEANQRERVVYHLKNAQAGELAQTLQDYFAGESELRRTTLGPSLSGSLLRELEQEVTVIGDPNSNKLIISASPRYIDTVQAIVEELDASPPQVMIEVLIAEVTLNASEEFGVDVSIGGTVATTSATGLPEQVGGSRIGGDGFVFDALAAGTGVATALGVPNLAVASSDFGLLIRALQSQGKLEVLSRPQVQVNDNESAFINVGENIAITDGVERRDNVTTAIVRREDIGITLDVTPSISSDGYVRLDISPEISILSDRTTQIDQDFQAPIITQRRVQTTVTIKDGETVVIGGLIQTNDSMTKTKTPLLGDLPLIGGLFRSNEQTQIKTELLVILTPHVIPGDRNGRTAEKQRELTERSLNSLEDRAPVDAMLELGDDPEEKPEVWDPLYDREWEDE